jgi:hypothetical protein
MVWISFLLYCFDRGTLGYFGSQYIRTVWIAVFSDRLYFRISGHMALARHCLLLACIVGDAAYYFKLAHSINGAEEGKTNAASKVQ